jgi:uncharacterized Ntn-hydrolase superfamily protein
MSRFPIFLIIVLCIQSLPAQQSLLDKTDNRNSIVATYSIVARDPETGDLGVAVQSKFLGVGAVVPWAKAGVGAVATQAFANTQFGEEGIRLLSYGLTAREAVDSLIHMDSDPQSRQLGIVDAKGNAYGYTGSSCMQYAGNVSGGGYTVQGNILAGEEVIKAIARTFEISTGDLADRLLEALDAGERAGGDKRGRQSAALLVVREQGGYGGLNDRFVDIRVDDNPQPLIELRRIYNLWKQEFLFEARMRSLEGFRKNKNFAAADREMQRVVTSMNNLLRDKPDDPDVLNNVAWTLATNDIDRVRALELAKRASKLAPSRADILDTIAECHYRLGHFDEAIAIETELATKDPANDRYWKQLQKFKDAKQKSGQ